MICFLGHETIAHIKPFRPAMEWAVEYGADPILKGWACLDERDAAEAAILLVYPKPAPQPELTHRQAALRLGPTSEVAEEDAAANYEAHFVEWLSGGYRDWDGES